MKKIIYTAEEMRRAEQNAVDRGTSFEQLMENAGQAAAQDILERLNDNRLSNRQSALIICGKGNNAGDGLVIARILAKQNINIYIVFLLGDNLSPLATLNLERLNDFTINYLKADDLDAQLINETNANQWMIIDAVFGTGYSGNLPESVAQAMDYANQSGAYQIALDIPTGLNCDTGELAPHTFEAKLTYSFAAYKPAHFMKNGKAVCGEVVYLDIGI